jgi:TonB family protein
MAQPPTSGPDPSKSVVGATGVLRAKSEDARFETDFAQLAACFSAQSGGGLSPELSSDLALEIVLNEVVEQACLTTGATGAAIALERDGEMVCRASSGATAPALGSRFDAVSGLSGECIRTHRTQRSDDVLADSRADVEAAQRMGVRSVMVMPLLHGDELVGLFELFSSLPQAFGERDDRTLEALADRILSSLERAAQPLPPQNEQLLFKQAESGSEVQEIHRQEVSPEIAENPPPETPPQPGFDPITWALRAAVLICAVFLGLLLGRHLGTPKAAVRQPAFTSPSAAANAPPAISPVVATRAEGKDAGTVPEQPATPAKSREKTVPAGGLQVFENGKEIFRMPPPPSESGQNGSEPSAGSGVQRASSAEPEPSSVAPESTLLHRVEPEYPEDALQQKIQGPVVLDVHIGGDGTVQDVQVSSGPPELAQAAIDAVKQWRFKPRRVNGRAVPMETTVTLNFRLPQ